MNKNPLIEGLKEIARNAIMAVIPVIIAGINTATGAISIDHKVVVATILFTLLTGLDRFLHVKNKEEKGDDGSSQGLVRI